MITDEKWKEIKDRLMKYGEDRDRACAPGLVISEVITEALRIYHEELRDE
jgi:hypothetical protein